MEQIHIHTDVENLIYFTDKNGVSAYCPRVIAYAMQGADVVCVFYTKLQMKGFYEHNRFAKNLPVIYRWNEEIWNKKHQPCNTSFGSSHCQS